MPRAHSCSTSRPAAGIPSCSSCSASPRACCRPWSRRPACSGRAGLPPLQDGTPVLAVMGDSHAALFAHAGWRPDRSRRPTAPALRIMSLGRLPDQGSEALCATIAWDDGTPQPAVEGNIRASGATLTWLAAVLETSLEALAERAAPSSEGVHLVPAFGGLGAPWWDDEAVGLISDLTFGTRTPHLARAALESIAFSGRGRGRRRRPRDRTGPDPSPTVGPPPTGCPRTAGRHRRPARARRALARALGARRRAPRGRGRRPVGPRDARGIRPRRRRLHAAGSELAPPAGRDVA